MAERVLVLLKPQFLGDAVMATPLIDALVSSGRETVVMCGAAVQQLLADRKGRVAFAHGEKIAGVRPVLRAARAIRALDVSTAFVVNRSFRSALAVRLARVKRRIGHTTEGRGFLLTHSVRYDPVRFEAECYLDLARAEGITLGDPKPILCVDPIERGCVFGIQPGARYVEKQVPMATMAAVANGLIAQGYSGVLLGGPDEVEDCLRFANLLNGPIMNLSGQGSIRDTMAVLAGLRVMIGSDTGLMHVAAAVGCPTVTVFGPNPASKWGHRYAPHEVLEAPKGKVGRVPSEEILGAVNRILDASNPNRLRKTV